MHFKMMDIWITYMIVTFGELHQCIVYIVNVPVSVVLGCRMLSPDG